jgi:hypothetical protein
MQIEFLIAREIRPAESRPNVAAGQHAWFLSNVRRREGVAEIPGRCPDLIVAKSLLAASYGMILCPPLTSSPLGTPFAIQELRLFRAFSYPARAIVSDSLRASP